MNGALTCEMTLPVGGTVAAVFAALSVLHVYWALGGKAGLKAAIPERPSTRSAHANDGTPANSGTPAYDGTFVKAFDPAASVTLLVAGALATVSALVSLRAGLFAPASSGWPLRASLVLIALILVARAVGDLNLVGFLKKTKGTRFAIWDTWVYSPVCGILALGMVSLVLSPGCPS